MCRLGIICIFFLCGCTQLQIKEGIFHHQNGLYSVNIPGKEWKSTKTHKEDLTLIHDRYNATIALISSNINDETLSPGILNTQLFIGIRNKNILLKESVQIGGQAAIHTVLEGNVNNHRIKIDAYVIKSGNMVFDLVYWAPLRSFDQGHKDFMEMIKTFTVTG